MKTIGIKLADGTFYPILEEGTPKKRTLDLTIARDNQTKVQIDLYRSESGTMQDAEYVDTLEVSNLNQQAVDDSELQLSLELDENNRLTAGVVDRETNRRSETQVNLVTRSAAERETPADFGVAEPPSDDTNPFSLDAPDDDDMFHKIPESTVREAPVQEEASTPEPSAFSEDTEIPDTPVSFDEPTVSEEPEPEPSLDEPAISSDLPDDATVSSDAPTVSEEPEPELSFDDMEMPSFDDSTVSGEPSESDDIITVDKVVGDTTAPEESLDEPFQFDDATVSDDSSSDFAPAPSDEVPSGETVSEEPPASDEFDIDTSALPDFDDIATENISDEPSVDNDTSDISFDIPDQTAQEPSKEIAVDDDITSGTESDSDIVSDLPDFSDLDFSSTETSPEKSDSADSSELDIDSSDLPDLSDIPDFDETPAEKSVSLDDDFTFHDSDTSSSNSDLFDLPDFDNLDLTEQKEEKDIEDFIDHSAMESDSSSQSYSSDMNLSSTPMDFSDLYDKETLNGEHATIYDNDDDEDDERSRVPIIICIICALICILTTLLILFVIPSKYNLIKSKNTKTTTAIESVTKTEKKEPSKQTGIAHLPEKKQESETAPVQQKETAKPSSEKKEPATETKITIPLQETKTPVKEEPKKEVVPPSAQENKIVIIPEEAVEKTVPVKVDVPEPKAEPKKETVQKKPRGQDVPYTIKWGDTLWDISDSYYKTPWKYMKIADYNHIKNPDIIISGTNILIPAE